ncbi:MAG: hypothetical protein ACRDZY_20855, partial [Acidimicrobiales bacterium]
MLTRAQLWDGGGNPNRPVRRIPGAARWRHPAPSARHHRESGYGTVDNVRFLRTSSSGDGEPSDDPAAHLPKLLAASARGEQQAFAQLYDLTSARVFWMVLRVVRD